MKIIEKLKKQDGRRSIYIFGKKVFSYRKSVKADKPKKLKSINKKELDIKLKNFNSCGICETSNNTPKLIVSLTSYPERMVDIHYCLYSLLNQSYKPNKVILWLGIEQFPNQEKDVPENVLKLKENGLSIKWCQDIRSYTKLIPALREYPDDIIVTADDDIFYPTDWLQKLYNEYEKKPTMIHCHRAHLIQFNNQNQPMAYSLWLHEISNVQPSFLNFFTGVGGVLYPPHCLNKDVLNEEKFKSLTPINDDIWFWAMAVLNGTKINIVKNNITQLTFINPDRELGLNGTTSLSHQNVHKNENDKQLYATLEAYPDLLKKLNKFIPAKTGERIIPERYQANVEEFILFLKHKFAYENALKYIKSTDRILEIGCGDGYGANILSQSQANITAIDIDIASIELAKEKYTAKNVHFESFDGINLKYPDHSFDVVVSFQVIEHVNDVALYLNNIKRVLKPNGKLLITTPSRTYRLAPGQKPWNKFHLREYDANTLKNDVEGIFPDAQILSITAKPEPYAIEFYRQQEARSDYDPKNRVDVYKPNDFLSRYSTQDFYVEKNNPDNGLDLLVVKGIL